MTWSHMSPTNRLRCQLSVLTQLDHICRAEVGYLPVLKSPTPTTGPSLRVIMSQTEVGQFDLQRLLDMINQHHVGGIDVSMNDPDALQETKSFSQLKQSTEQQ